MEDPSYKDVGRLSVHGVSVAVQAYYLEEQSSPEKNRFIFAYHVTIANNGDQTVQLLRRRWRITNDHGLQEHVEGEGVIGEQPIIRPGKLFEYVSGTPLTTPSGFMEGAYQMQNIDSGVTFEVPIPTFSLDSPHADLRIH